MMKSYMKQSGLRLAAVALAVIAFLIGLLWRIEVQRLILSANLRGWAVEFVPSFQNDPLGVTMGIAVHGERVMYIRSGLDHARRAAVLRHELEHAAGSFFARTKAWMRCGGTWGGIAGLISASFETVAGSVLACTTSVPASYTEAGYGASSMTYTTIGEITDLGSGYGRTYNVVNHAPISEAAQTQKKGSYTRAAIEVTMAWDQSDAGQDLLRTAAADNSILTFKLRKQGGDIRYFTAQVSKFVENFGTVDNVVVGMVTLLPQTDIVMNPA